MLGSHFAAMMVCDTREVGCTGKLLQWLLWVYVRDSPIYDTARWFEHILSCIGLDVLNDLQNY